MTWFLWSRNACEKAKGKIQNGSRFSKPYWYLHYFLWSVLHLTFQRQSVLTMLRKKISFLTSGCTDHWYITVFQQRPQSDWKQRQSFIPLQSREKREIAQKWRWHCSAILHLKCMMAIVGKKSYCHSERSLYKNLVSSSLEESVHLICHWWSKLALYVTTIYQHWTWESQVPKMADQITKESLSSWSDQTKSKLC